MEGFLKMHTPYIVVAALCLISLVIRTSYELLKKSGRVNQNNKAAIAFVFLAMCMMLSSWCFMCPNDPWRIGLPHAVRLSGIGVIAAGLVIALAGMVQLRGVENIDHLVTDGIFSKIRHPMYLGFILWILGWATYYGAVASLIAGLMCIGNILYWRRLEEKKLVADYGEAYLEYRKGTWF
jgi:protein-S-isoprenylcysteine O-methyltransferase Ste14